MLGFNRQNKSINTTGGASMNKSIQHFIEFGTEKLEKKMVEFASEPTKIAEMVYGVIDSVTELGRSIIAEEWETLDEIIRQSGKRKENWHVVRKDFTTLVTHLGPVRYSKTLFKHKTTGEYAYLLDKIMGLDSHVRLTEDAVAKVLEEAVETSYRKGGKNACITPDEVSKQTVLNKIHKLKFPEIEPAAFKKVLSYLYIDCDEDHVALQFLDTQEEELEKNRRKSTMPKIIYVYEGVDDECGRNRLVNPKYFGGVYEGKEGVETLWKEVRRYIESSYDVDSLERIYINGDGAGWIKSGQTYIPNGKFVLDKFHLHKYIIKATSHLWDSVEDAREMLYKSIRKKNKRMTEEIFNRILYVTEESSKRKAVEEAKRYTLGNWSGIMQQIKAKDCQLKCSAEGHVSHIYSDRLSSRPLGWSKTGVDKMARLRIFRANHGDMLRLVRYQKLDKAAGAEEQEIIYSCDMMLQEERRQRSALGKLYGLKIYTMPYPQVKKIAYFKDHITGL